MNGEEGFKFYHSDIADLLGMPLRTMTIPWGGKPHPTPIEANPSTIRTTVFRANSDRPSDVDQHNQMAPLLHIPIKFEPEVSSWSTWGKVSKYWLSKELGTVIVSGEDGKPLSAAYLEALCAWTEKNLQPHIRALQKDGTRMTQEAREEFEQTKTRAPKMEQATQALIDAEKTMTQEITMAKFKAWCKKSGFDPDDE